MARSELLLDGLGDELRLPAEHVAAEAHEHIDVLVAVEIPEPRAGGLLDHDRIDELLDPWTESGHDSRIRHRGSVVFRPLLGRLRTRGVAPDQRVEPRALPGREVVRVQGDSRDRAEGLLHAFGRVGRWGGGRDGRRDNRCSRRGRQQGNGWSGGRVWGHGRRSHRGASARGHEGRRSGSLQRRELPRHELQLLLDDPLQGRGRCPVAVGEGRERHARRSRRERGSRCGRLRCGGRRGYERLHNLYRGYRGLRRELTIDVLGEGADGGHVFHQLAEGQLDPCLFLNRESDLRQEQRVEAQLEERGIDLVFANLDS